MNKTQAILILTFSTLGSLAEQTPLLQESFSGTGLPTGWNLLGGAATVQNGALNLNSGCVQLPGTYQRAQALTVEADVTN